VASFEDYDDAWSNREIDIFEDLAHNVQGRFDFDYAAGDETFRELFDHALFNGLSGREWLDAMNELDDYAYEHYLIDVWDQLDWEDWREAYSNAG
jgi:hypothetical protein